MRGIVIVALCALCALCALGSSDQAAAGSCGGLAVAAQSCAGGQVSANCGGAFVRRGPLFPRLYARAAMRAQIRAARLSSCGGAAGLSCGGAAAVYVVPVH